MGDHKSDDCADNLRNYWQDLTNGAEKQQQLKVQLVGNGRVGKTTLADALEYKRAPSEPFKSTHGIVIKEIQQALDGEDEPITLQLWDFGGQEIYHATHRLFLSDDCLYLLLWAEETEEHSDETRHPVSYWLELIHDLAPNSQVIVVKNQIDQFNKLPLEPLDLASDVPGYGQIREFVKISALKYQGMYMLEGAIKEVLQDPKLQACVELPISWLQVQRELKQLDQKTIPFAHFKQLCIKAGVGHAEWFAGYLHKTGVLFYQRGAFQDQIILDQNWVIEAAYRVFDPKDQRSFIEDDLKGRFKSRHAKTVWPEVDETEREIYLDFMRNCGICYEPNRKHDTPFAERTFIIPALLPEDIPTRSAWQKNATDWQLDIEYPFLHRSIIERIILSLGETYQGEPWRTGIFCNTEYGQVLLECAYRDKKQSTQGQLSFHLRGNQLAPLVYALRKLVSEISPHHRYQEFLRKGSEERAQPPECEENPQMPTLLDEIKPTSKTVKLFISYAHEDEKPYREELDKRLKAIKRQYPMLEPWHDRNLLAGEQVHDKILQQLEVADIVVLLISPDFVDSDYCFSHEMEIALKQYEQNQNIVIPIIIRDTADWHTYQIGNHVALPTDGKPLCDWSSPDKFWADVQQGIRKQVENLLKT
ncbi:COR domain-containing protein [Thiothrix caldifontis]|uniref:COR domain-containing protein n=1 Tax=Thiothrix caldifontis TaxID=525918 RepID=UPI001FDF5011|nr:COR domain-containing protein [Thiothrix caldifontis]